MKAIVQDYINHDLHKKGLCVTSLGRVGGLASNCRRDAAPRGKEGREIEGEGVGRRFRDGGSGTELWLRNVHPGMDQGSDFICDFPGLAPLPGTLVWHPPFAGLFWPSLVVVSDLLQPPFGPRGCS